MINIIVAGFILLFKAQCKIISILRCR